jgi:hypothetical protein
VRLAVLAFSLAAAAAAAAAGTALAAGGPVATPPALGAVAAALAREVGPPAEGRRALLLEVDARAPSLAAPLETALAGALAAAGYAVTPSRPGGDAEARARAAGQDWLLRVRAGLVPGRRELAAVGELIPAWASFFLQRQPGARAIAPRIVRGSAAADPESLLLAREGAPAGAPFASVRRIARVPGRVLAVTAGEPGEPGRPAIVVVTGDAVLVLGPRGERIAARDLDATELRPVRAPAATVAIGEFGGGRIALRRAGAARGEVLSLAGGRLEPAGTLDAAPLCAGDAGLLLGDFEPGTGVLADRLSALVDPAAAPRSPRTLYGAACAPRGGRIAHAVLGTDLRLELLDPELRPVAVPPPPATGCGFALADLDGDGAAELVLSSADPAAPDAVRVVAPLSGRTLPVDAPPVAGSILAGGAGDLTGDGVDDAVLAAVVDGGAATDLLLVTSDPREAP